jgi:hypothetical protein
MSGRCARSAVALLLRYRRQCTVFLCFAAGAVAAQTAISASPPMPEFTMENPAPGIYQHYGQQAEMTAANLGDVAWRSSTPAERLLSVERYDRQSGG